MAMVDRQTVLSLFRWPPFQSILVIAAITGALYVFGDDASQNMREGHMAEIALILEKEKNLAAPLLIENETYKRTYELIDNETGCAVRIMTEAKWGWCFTGLEAARLPNSPPIFAGDGIKRQISKTYLETGEYTVGIWRTIYQNGVVKYEAADESILIGA